MDHRERGGSRSTRGAAPPDPQQLEIKALQTCQAHETASACTLDPACVATPEMGCVSHTVLAMHQAAGAGAGPPIGK
jgi:hypothetical protein